MASYSQTIDLRVTGNALKEVDLITKRINDLRSLTKSLKPVPNLFDKRGSERITKEKEELRKLVEQYGKGTGSGNRFSNTIAGLNSQLSGFNRILSNVNIKSDEFVQSLTASEKISRRLSRAEAERLSVLNKINTASTVGRAGSVKEVLDLSKIIPKSVAGLEFYQQQLQDTLRTVNIGSSDYRELAAAIASVNQQLSVAQGSGRIQGPALPPGFNERGRIPSGGGGGRRGGRFQDIATGAGFPLLFGGGPLQALAGGIGGAAGGLGGSIAASALTAQVEAFATEAAKVGQALNSTSGALELMREKSLFSKVEIENRAAELEKQGRVEELAALLTGELTQLIGNEGVRSLQELGKTTNETTKLWNQLTTQLFALVSGPLNAFLKVVNQVLGAVAGAGSREAFFGDLGSQEGAARSRFKELTGESLGTGRSGSKARAKARSAGQVFLSQEDALAQIKKEFKPVNAASIPVTEQDQRDFSVSGGRAKKGRKSRLSQLEIEIGLQERLLGLNTKIAEAKRDGNEGAAAVLEVEKIFEKTAANINKIKLENLTQGEKAAKIRSEELKGLQQVESVNNRMRDLAAQKAENAANTIQQLEDTLELSQAIGREEKNRLEIEQKLKKLEKDGMEGPQLAQAKSLMQQINNENAPLNQFIKQSVDSLNDLEASAVRVSQGIGNAIGGSLASGLQGLVSGAKSVKDVFADMLESVGQTLAQEGAKMIATYIAIGIAKAFAGLGGGKAPTDVPQMTDGAIVTPTGFTGQFAGMAANGGPVSGGQPYLVGERGPELFVPFQGGSITSNEQLDSQTANAMSVPFLPGGDRGNSVSRYERMSSSFKEINQTSVPFTRTSEQAAAAASERETAQAIANPSPIDVRFESQSINGVEYVTADQHQQGMSQAAERGRALTLAALQNSVKSRRRVGL